ncbi:MAG: NAD(P)-dependent oxidoreductase [Rhodomicrobiaceae bacterium]
MPDIIISEFMDAAPIERLRAGHSVHIDDGLWNKRSELEALAADALAIIVRNRTRVDAALIEKAPRLAVVGRLGVGLDNIDVEACKARGIAVCPAIGANAVAVAEYVLASSLMLLRFAAFSGTARLMEGQWPREEMGAGHEGAGKTLGLVGFGSIGQVTAAKARALGFATVAADAFLPESDPAWRATERVALPALLARADIITLHCPLTPQTRSLIGAAEIAALKPGAMLINTARGGIVDEAALAAALRAGHLAGAAIDVFETEPLTGETAAHFAGLPNVILTPHIAGITVESNTRISAVTVDNVLKVLKEREL